ncbi:MAG: ERCC4 domain-containing protein [Promethearchaeota archaeon]
MKQIRIIVDKRERISGIPDLLRQEGIQLSFKQLSVGDYVLSNRCAVERKSASDFVSSMFSGRLFDQVQRLSGAYELPLIIIEGNFFDPAQISGKEKAIYGAIAKISVETPAKFLFTESREKTATLLSTLANHEQTFHGWSPIVRRSPKQLTEDEMKLFVITSLPNIGLKLAYRLLRNFGTVKGIFNATSAELSRVEGIGRKKAQTITKLIKAPYGLERDEAKQIRLGEYD